MYSPLAFIGNLGWPEILIILFLALLLFGGKRLPSLAKDLGDGIRSFRKSLSGDDSESAKIQEPEEKPATSTKKSKKSA
ncbi:twin-arginine translocase TatA/TatE family subunit [Leptospira langatensis]|uniref:Sec-independent protein translocase protein TatA n=1 Tax=Leptospira langatensis TaxID=2484983 RepID=A0A5F1ZRH4_9LEPT|nr:twin-arginine translocase TatA/TatE family subunit [Leptospira langatensis]TGK05496.1 twin-arginine translocase TatA/TatE family subunit [Leptospira langatensis]TGL38632.1 twin-arginine translocase TatA/TatE family subunit [Leptospira langatensis]